HSALVDRHFGTGDAYGRELRAIGHDATMVIANCWPLQLAWAQQHRSSVPGRNLARLPTRFGITARNRALEAIALAQIERFDPEVVYLQDLWYFESETLDQLRRDGRLVVGQIASAPPEPEVLRHYNLLISSLPHFVERFEALGIKAAYLPIAFDTAVI